MLRASALIETTLRNSVLLYFLTPPPTKHPPPPLYIKSIEMLYVSVAKADSVCDADIFLSVVLPDCITQITADSFWLSDNFWSIWGGKKVGRGRKRIASSIVACLNVMNKIIPTADAVKLGWWDQINKEKGEGREKAVKTDG